MSLNSMCQDKAVFLHIKSILQNAPPLSMGVDGTDNMVGMILFVDYKAI